MALPTFPALLGKPVQPGFSRRRGDRRLSTRMASGHFKVRGLASQAPMAVAASYLWDARQLDRFDRFFENETAGGTLPFLMPDPMRTGLKLLTDAGLPVLAPASLGGAPLRLAHWWLARFAEDQPPPEDAVEDWPYWRTALHLTIYP